MSAESGATTASVVIRALVDASATLGLDRGELLGKVGLREQDLDSLEARVPRTAEHALWMELARRSGDEQFGLHFAERSVQPGNWGALDYAFRASATLGEATESIARFFPILCGAAVVTFERDGDRATIGYRRDESGPPHAYHAAECAIAGYVIMARQLVGIDWTPIETTFTHPAPKSTSEHRRIFRSPVRFGADINAVVLEASLLDRPAKAPDPRLRALLDAVLESLLAKLPQRASFAEHVQRHLFAACQGGDPTVAAVARAFHTTPRSLQRRLAAEGTSHRELLDAVRRDLAVSLLRDSGKSASEVAAQLGFADPSAFFRSFRRWTGKSPREFLAG